MNDSDYPRSPNAPEKLPLIPPDTRSEPVKRNPDGGGIRRSRQPAYVPSGNPADRRAPGAPVPEE